MTDWGRQQTGPATTDSARDDGKASRVDGHAWVPLTGLDDLPEPVWPACLAGIVAAATGDPSAWPGDVGRVEESTVPIGNLVDPASRQD